MRFTPIIAIILFIFASTAQADYYSQERNYRVSVTNITKGLQFTPLLAATHKRSVAFFEVGDLSSPELALLAEGGDITPLNDLLSAIPEKVATTTSTAGLLAPGETAEFDITSRRGFPVFSIAAMLLPTNDSFLALNKVRLPRFGSVTYYAKGYDAGSEPNDELCANIPGPTCGGSGSSPEAGGEGYVFPSQGIHGEADLSAASYDWRGAVAKITIYRVK